MKPRVLWTGLAVIALTVATVFFYRQHASAKRARRMTPIEDGKTIDFSPGKAVIRESEKETAIIGASVKEMEAAAEGMIFGSKAKSPAQKTP